MILKKRIRNLGLESLLHMTRQTYAAKKVTVSDFYLPELTTLCKQSHSEPHYLAQHPNSPGDMKTLGRTGIYRFPLRIFQSSICSKVQQSSELEIIWQVLFKCLILLCSQVKTSPHPLSIMPATYELGVRFPCDPVDSSSRKTDLFPPINLSDPSSPPSSSGTLSTA